MKKLIFITLIFLSVSCYSQVINLDPATSSTTIDTAGLVQVKDSGDVFITPHDLFEAVDTISGTGVVQVADSGAIYITPYELDSAIDDYVPLDDSSTIFVTPYDLTLEDFVEPGDSGILFATQTDIDEAVAPLLDTADAETTLRLLTDTIDLFDFPFGSGQTADTALFNNNALAGGRHLEGGDSLKITKVTGVLVEGTGTEIISIQMSWHATFKSGSATNLFSSAQAITSITTGTSLMTFANSTIPPNVWVWLTLSGVSAGNRPSMLVLSVYGYIQNRSY